MLLPGAGFDVVPSDCLASQLKSLVPDATSLELAFATKGGLSRGTAKTMVENIDKGHQVRKAGKLSWQPLGKITREINFGPFKRLSVGISWGDICTAFYSTGIPHITVFTATDQRQLRYLRIAHKLRWLLGRKPMKRFLQKQIDKRPPGPSEKKRRKHATYFWGKAQTGGQSSELRLKVPNGYDLTALAVVLISKKILEGNFKAGYQTPATAYGKDLIFEIDGCSLI